MDPADQALRRELLAMAAEDGRVRQALLGEGVLFDGYHPRMVAVHRAIAGRMIEVIDAGGWPGASRVGQDGAEAAWLMVQHAIGEPELQRHALRLIQEAVQAGEAPAWQAAMLEDRIRMFEGRPQIYGTQLERGPDGRARPYMLEDPAGVEERRREVGLDPLQDVLARSEPSPVPRDPEAFERGYQAWLRRVGWRE